MNVAETIIEIDESGTSHIVTRGYPLAVSLFVAAKAEPFRALVVEVLALDPDLVLSGTSAACEAERRWGREDGP